MSGLRGLVNVSVGGVRLAPDASARRSSWYRATSQDTARPSALDHEPRSDFTPCRADNVAISTPSARMPNLLAAIGVVRSAENTFELKSLMRNSYADFCLKKQRIVYIQILTRLLTLLVKLTMTIILSRLT